MNTQQAYQYVEKNRPETQLDEWESNLLTLASGNRRSLWWVSQTRAVDAIRLAEAYAHCEALIAQHSRSFYWASALLPPQKRRAARVLYAFCRVSDNIVDAPNINAEQGLSEWRHQALYSFEASKDLVALAWREVRRQYAIPNLYAEQLIDGISTDLTKKRYGTFQELAHYAYGVASTVGLMSMHIIGYASNEAIPYAIKLGVALQLTNILRDVGEDWLAGRVYLPQEELAEFGLSNADIGLGKVTERWQDFMRFQIARNRRLYREAMPGIRMLHADGRLAITAAARFYRAILGAIEDNHYDVFNRRAYLNSWGKLRRMPQIWRQARSGVG